MIEHPTSFKGASLPPQRLFSILWRTLVVSSLVAGALLSMRTGHAEEENFSRPNGLVDISLGYEPKNAPTRLFATSPDLFTDEAGDDEVSKVIRFVAGPLLLSKANWCRPNGQSNCANCSKCKPTSFASRPTPVPNAPLVQTERPVQTLPPVMEPTMLHQPINPTAVFHNAPNMAYVPGPVQAPPIQPPPPIQNILPPGPPPQFNPVGPNYAQPFGPLPMGPTFNQAPVPPFQAPAISPPFASPPTPAGNPFLSGRVGPPPPPPPPLAAVRVGPPNIPLPPISRPAPPAANPIQKILPQPAMQIPQITQPVAQSKQEIDLAKELRYMHINLGTEADSDVISARTTSQCLRDIYADLNELGLEAGCEPFDTTRTFVGRCVQRLKLLHPTEWRLSLRIHSCTNCPNS